MDVTLPMPAALVPRSAVGFVAGLVEFVKRALRNLALSDEERNLLNLATYIGVKVGAPLLSAQSVDDLDDRIDKLIEGPELLKQAEFGLRVLSDDAFQAAMKRDRVLPADVFGAFGKGEVLRSLEEGDRLALEIFSAVWQLKALLPATVDLASGPLGEPDPMGFLADPRVPVPVAEAYLGSFQAAACQAAVMQALITGQRPEPWLALAIAERWVKGERAFIRLLASMPGVSVGEDVVPMSERLDLTALVAQSRSAEERFRQQLDAARTSGESICPPIGDPPDERS